MPLTFWWKLCSIQALIRLDLVASTVLNHFQAVSFLSDWTNSVYKTQQIAISSLPYCASICIKELDKKCSFFYPDSKTCLLGNLTLMNNTGLAPLRAPDKLLIHESK